MAIASLALLAGAGAVYQAVTTVRGQRAQHLVCGSTWVATDGVTR
jgi:hypothetical protein